MNWMRRKVPPSTAASVLTVSVLARPGHALQQHVPAREQRDEQALEHRVLPDDHALDLVQGLLEARARVLEGGRLPTGVVHQTGGRRLASRRPGRRCEPPPSCSGQSPRSGAALLVLDEALHGRRGAAARGARRVAPAGRQGRRDADGERAAGQQPATSQRRSLGIEDTWSSSRVGCIAPSTLAAPFVSAA